MILVQIKIDGSHAPPEIYEMTDEAHTFLCRFASALQDMNVDVDEDVIELALADLEEPF